MKDLLRVFWICLLSLNLSVLSAQSVVYGTVSDTETGYPLSFVSIRIEHDNYEVLTNENGYYELEISDSDTLVFSLLGYASKSFAGNISGELNVRLSPTQQLIYNGSSAMTITGRAIRLKLPASIMQIYPEHLKRDVDVSITPALNRVSGVYMHSGALNTNRITIRGIGNRSLFSTTKLRAYLDDIPLTSGDGETTLEDIDLSLINRVDVWKGPTASTYGAGLGGMIHLKTNAETSSTYSNLENAFTIGSYGLIRNVLKGDLTLNENTLQVGYNLNLTQNDGYRDNNEYDRQGASLLIKYQPSPTNVTTVFGNYIDLKAFIPSSLNRDDYLQNPEKAAFTWGNVQGFEDYTKSLLGISHKQRLLNANEFSLYNTTSLFGNLRNSYEARPFNNLSEESNSLGLRSRFELKKGMNSDSRQPLFTLGVEAFRETYQWQTYKTDNGVQQGLLSNNEEVRKMINFFLQSNVNIGERTTIFGGINFNSTRFEYDDLFLADGIDQSGDYTFGNIFSPQLGINYNFNYKLALFATISHGFSPPSLSETLTPDGNINPDIQPEKGWNFEIGSRGKLSNFTYEITAYTMQINDLLVAQRIGDDQFIGLNAGKTNHNGLEVFLEYKTYLGDYLELKPFVTYTYSNYHFEDFVDGDNDFSGNELTGTPPHQLNAGIDFSSEIGMYGSLNYRFVDAFPMRDDNSIYSESYQVTNLKVGYEKQISQKFEIDFSMGIRNIFDEKYASMILINAGSFGGNAPRYYYPGLPRNYFIGLSVRYNFTSIIP